MSTTPEPHSVLALKNWLAENGGEFNKATRFCEDSSGLRIIAVEDMPKDTHVVSCPFPLVITQQLAKAAIIDILGELPSTNSDHWTERQWISTYLSCHWIIGSVEGRLSHFNYLNTLPSPEKLRTPLHFSSSELDLFKGTNIYGATLDRESIWRTEWNQCRALLSQANDAWGELYTWDMYLTTATYLSSRAFPSSLLSPTPSLIHSSSTQPILIPGVDSLNHARGHPVSWVVINSHNAEPAKVSLVHHPSANKGTELFNNYGPKPNSELILGYGFSLPHNPDDTIVLKVGGIEGGKWEIGRNASNSNGLWKEILATFLGPDTQEPTYEDILDASGMLQEMIVTLLSRLPDGGILEPSQVRPEVVQMFHHYLEGQKDILHSLLKFAGEREQDAIEVARKQGINIVLEEG